MFTMYVYAKTNGLVNAKASKQHNNITPGNDIQSAKKRPSGQGRSRGNKK